MPFRKPCIILVAASLLFVLNPGARADSFECDATVIDVVVGRNETDAGPLSNDVYFVPAKEMEITAESIFEVFRPGEVDEPPVRHYPLLLYIGRLQIIDTQDEILIGRMIEFASSRQHPRVRHLDVMIGDCLRLEPAEEPPMVVPDELPAEAIDLEGLDFSVEGRVIPSKILFKFDMSVVEDTWSDELGRLADYISTHKPARVVVEGHADWIGADEYNIKLSQRRARAMVDYLVTRHGLEREIFDVEAYGESRPEVSNETAEGRQKNRRAAASVLFKVIPTAGPSTPAPPSSSLVIKPAELEPEETEIPVIPGEPPND